MLAGTELLALIYRQEQVTLLHGDGQLLQAETVFARVSGSARRLLTLERTALNLLQRTSGIATATRKFVEAVECTKCQVLDTRKTAPGMRRLEKLAVRAGRGVNHRIGLFDAILIKNNHITAAGGVSQALAQCRKSGLAIELEVRTFDELDEALAQQRNSSITRQLHTGASSPSSRASRRTRQNRSIRQYLSRHDSRLRRRPELILHLRERSPTRPQRWISVSASNSGAIGNK